jgi:hypothetical protein
MRNTGTITVPKVPITKGKNKGIKMVYRPDRGRLPANISEPLFVADPNHRKKAFTGDLYKLNLVQSGCYKAWQELWLYGEEFEEEA